MKAKETQDPPKRIPEFASYEEQADFWDKYSPEDFPDEFEDADITFASPLEIVRVRNWRDTLADALANLPDGQRQVLSLSILGLNDAQIARIMGYSPAQCQKALRAARRKARAISTASHK